MYGNQYGQQYSGTEGIGQLFNKALTDAVNLTSSILRSIGKLFLSAINTTSVMVKGMTRLFTDAISLVQMTIETVKAFGKAFLENIGVTDFYSRVLAKTLPLTDAINISEVFTTTRYLVRAFTDAISVISSITRQRIIIFLDSLRVRESYIMRLNGIVIHWYAKARSAVGIWTNKVRSLVSWTNTTRVTSSWTDKERAE